MRPRAGSVLVLSIVVMFVLGTLCVGFLSLAGSQGIQTAKGADSERALQIAEAAVAKSIEEINGKVDYDGNGIGNVASAAAPASFGGGTHYATAVQDPASLRWTISAFGTFSGTKAKRNIQVIVDRQSNSLFLMGLFGNNSIANSGSPRNLTDSYKSSLGSYASQATNSYNGIAYAGSKGSIGSNGQITLSGNVHVFGNATPGVSSSVLTSGNVYVQGSTASESTSRTLPPVVYTPPAASQGTYQQSGGIRTLSGSAGPIRFSSFSMSGPSALNIDGNVTMYVDSSFQMSGQSVMTLLPGATLTVYQGPSGNFQVSGQGIVNLNNLPKNLQIYSAATDVAYSGQADFYGTMYAPAASLAISGNGQVYGAVVGQTIAVSGNGDFHYDEDLANVGAPGPYKPVSWQELPIWAGP